MVTTVPSKNDLDKLLAEDARLEQKNAEQDAADAENLKVDAAQSAELAAQQAEIDELRAKLAAEDAEDEALAARLAALEAKIAGAPQSAPEPAPDPDPIDIPPVPVLVPSGVPIAANFTRGRTGAFPAIVKTPAELLASNLLPPFAGAAIRGDHVYKTLTYSPGAWFDNPSLEAAEEGALINNASGVWLAGGDPHNMLAWAEAHGSFPNHWVDPATGRLYSIVDQPKGTAHKNPAFVSDSLIKLDGAHYPSLLFAAWLATRDPYYLEELQFAANYHLWSMNPEYRGFDQGWLYTGEARAFAWGLRDQIIAYLATPDGDVPAPLLPKSYWAHVIESNRLRFEQRWVNNGDGVSFTGCHFVNVQNGGKIAPWQQDWIGAVMGWMLLTGDPLLAKWRSNYEWHMRQAIGRTSGKSGFPRTQAVQYWSSVVGVTDMASFAAVNGYVETADGLISSTNMHYAESLRANLKLAALNGIPDAAECFDWLDPQVTVIDPKWAV